MAKFRNKTERLRYNVLRTVKRLEKKGYEISESIKESLKTANYSRLSSYQKDRYRRLYRESERISPVTGRTVSGFRYRLEISRVKREAKETSRRVEESLGRYSRRTKEDYTAPDKIVYVEGMKPFDVETGEIVEETETQKTAPDNKAQEDFYNDYGYDYGGSMANDDVQDQIIDNVIGELLTHLIQETPEYYYDEANRKHWLNPETKNDIDSKKNNLVTLINEQIMAGNKENLAKNIQENSDILTVAIDQLLGGYYEQARTVAYNTIASILTGRPMSAQDALRNDAYQAMIEGYNEPV